jgi:hypothetical protein
MRAFATRANYPMQTSRYIRGGSWYIFIDTIIYLGYETPEFYDDVIAKANMSKDIAAEGNMFEIPLTLKPVTDEQVFYDKFSFMWQVLFARLKS